MARVPALLYAVLLCAPALAVSAKGSASATMQKMESRLQQVICQQMRPAEKNCTVKAASATHTALPDNQDLWAFTWNANTSFARKGGTDTVLRDLLEKENVQVLDTFPDHFTGIAYYRESAKNFQPLPASEFAMITLNSVYKAVARIDPLVLQAGDLRYQLPEAWQRDGVKASDSGEVLLTFVSPAPALRVRLADLDDAELKGISIAKCELSGKACEAGGITTEPGREVQLRVSLQAARKIKSTQPAFKLLLQDDQGKQTFFQLAIPFRPGPNYVVFGTAGFLFGGLIAVMVLFMRRKDRPG